MLREQRLSLSVNNPCHFNQITTVHVAQNGSSFIEFNVITFCPNHYLPLMFDDLDIFNVIKLCDDASAAAATFYHLI